jgi:hypothetical protein
LYIAKGQLWYGKDRLSYYVGQRDEKKKKKQTEMDSKWTRWDSWIEGQIESRYQARIDI